MSKVKYESGYRSRDGLTQTDSAAYQRQWYAENIEHCRESVKNKFKRYRLEALEFLGNKCAVCGFSDIRALCVDHINGNGNKERKKIKMGVYKRVFKHPEDYQCLCCNCNHIKQVENHEY